MIDELDEVVLTCDLPDHGLAAGDIGTVVLVHGEGKGYEVEFMTLDGETIAVVALRAEQVRSPLIEQAMATLAARPEHVADRAAELLAGRGLSLDGARISLVGLSYKPGVQDVRESPSLALAEILRDRGAIVSAHDPVVGRDVVDASGVSIPNTPAPSPEDLDLAVVMTLHPGVDHDWLSTAPLVLDATYRLERSERLVPL